MPIVECVPNFSEGRDRSVIDRIAAAMAAIDGVSLLDVDPGESTNRTVVTFVGPPDAVVEAGALPLLDFAYQGFAITDPDSSVTPCFDLALQVAFPLLLANLTGWLAPSGGSDLPEQVAPGAPRLGVYPAHQVGITLGIEHDHRVATTDVLCDQDLGQAGLADPCRTEHQRVAVALVERHPDVLFVRLDRVQLRFAADRRGRTQRIEHGVRSGQPVKPPQCR